MKTLALSLCLCFLLLGCKKDLPLSPGETKKYAVTFKASDFSEEVTKFSKQNVVSDVPLKGMATKFAYIVYDRNGNEVNHIRQESSGRATLYSEEVGYTPYELGTQDFGTIRDSLPSGIYTVVMIATSNDLSINYRNDDSEYLFTPLQEAFFQFRRGLDPLPPRASDTFFKKFTITVGKTDLQQTVVLDRIVAKAEINILDAQPGMTFRIEFEDHEAYKFSTESSYANTFYDDVYFPEDNYDPNYNGPLGKKYSNLLLNTSSPMDIKIIYNGIEKVIEGVQFYKNKRTILTGNFFTSNPTTLGFTATVNDEFDTDSTEVSF